MHASQTAHARESALIPVRSACGFHTTLTSRCCIPCARRWWGVDCGSRADDAPRPRGPRGPRSRGTRSDAYTCPTASSSSSSRCSTTTSARRPSLTSDMSCECLMSARARSPLMRTACAPSHVLACRACTGPPPSYHPGNVSLVGALLRGATTLGAALGLTPDNRRKLARLVRARPRPCAFVRVHVCLCMYRAHLADDRECMHVHFLGRRPGRGSTTSRLSYGSCRPHIGPMATTMTSSARADPP